MNQNIKQGVHPNRPEEKKPKKQAAHSCSNGHPKRTEPVWKLLAWTKEDLHLQATKKASTNRRHCEARTVLFSPTKKKKTQGIKTDLKSEAKTRKLRSGTDPYLVRMILPSLASKEGGKTRGSRGWNERKECGPESQEEPMEQTVRDDRAVHRGWFYAVTHRLNPHWDIIIIIIIIIPGFLILSRIFFFHDRRSRLNGWKYDS
jgi:hypothetical protein